MALGSWLGGRLARRVRDPVRAYAQMDDLLTYSRLRSAPLEKSSSSAEECLTVALDNLRPLIAEKKATITRGPMPFPSGASGETATKDTSFPVAGAIAIDGLARAIKFLPRAVENGRDRAAQ